jgi:hypothetical protein
MAPGTIASQPARCSRPRPPRPLGSLLAVVNAKFDTGIPPTADQYEIVLVKA